MIKTLLFVGLGAMLAARPARAADPAGILLSSEATFASGFQRPVVGCIEDLITNVPSDPASPARFRRLALGRQIQDLHGTVDRWHQILLAHQDASFFEDDAEVQRRDDLLRRMRVLSAVPGAKLTPFARELRVISGKLEYLTGIAGYLDPDHVRSLREVLQVIADLPLGDSPTDHALQSLLLAQMAHVKVTEPVLSVDGQDTVIFKPSPEVRARHESALRDLRNSVDHDDLGLGWVRYPTYAAIMLQYFVPMYAEEEIDEQPLVAREIDDLLDLIEYGIRVLTRSTEPWDREQLAHLRNILSNIARGNPHLIDEVPGLTDRLKRLVHRLKLTPVRDDAAVGATDA